MVLPTRVNIINDSSERIKVKIDNDRDPKFDEIINIEPGSRLDDIEGSVWRGGWFSEKIKLDVIVDIITNPDGPDNNTRLGGFKFDNPTWGPPNVRSGEFTTLYEFYDPNSICSSCPPVYRLQGKYSRSELASKSYWGRLDSSLLDDLRFPFNFNEPNALLINSAPKPTFTVEAFFNDSEAGAKVWDLRINSDNFTL